MRYHRPTFVLGLAAGTTPGDKLGGLPVGVQLEDWPCCAACGGAMSLIAQLHHDADRLDLGREGRVLTLWQCEHHGGECPTWEADGGANAVLVLDVAQDPEATVPRPDPDTLVHPEAVARSWDAGDDGVPEDRASAFHDWHLWNTLEPEVRNLAGDDTQLGGAPGWVQGPEGPPHPVEYVGQLTPYAIVEVDREAASSGGYGLYRRVGPVDPVRGARHLEREVPAGMDADDVAYWLDDTPDGRLDGWTVDGPNFGDGGAGYVFLDRTVDPPRGLMSWQCH